MSCETHYIGMDVHKEAIVIVVLNGSGKLVMETILETNASSILQFIHGLRGELHVTWEEGTWAAWLYDLLQPQVQQVLVCNPRRNALLKEGSKSDKVDARKLAELLRTGMLHSLCRHPGLCPALSGGMVEPDHASRRAPPSGTVLSTSGWTAGFAAKSTRRVFGRKPET